MQKEDRKEKKKIGILRGGANEHYSFSIKKGGDIILHLLENLSDKYKPIDIFIDKDDIWHLGGVPIAPFSLSNKVDLIWNVSKHPEISSIVNSFSIPVLNNESFLKILENNKDILRNHLKNFGVQMPKSIVLPVYQEDIDGPKEKYALRKAKEVFEKFCSPWIVKSYTPDNNQGIHLAKTFPELIEAILDGVDHNKSILVEEFISGKVDSLHSVKGSRGENIYVFPVKNFLDSEKEKLNNLIKVLHENLPIKDYFKSDFVLHPKRGIFLTNIELVPDLRIGSHFEQACNSVGAKTSHIIDHILQQKLNIY